MAASTQDYRKPMIDALYISASGLRSEQKQIDVISNNVANMQTPGFKRGRVNFVEMASPGISSAGIASSSESDGNGTRIVSISTLFSPGELKATGNPLDLAIEGEGFFEIETQNGELLYTRDGQFRIDAEGYLVTVDGLGLSKSLQIPPDASDVRIAADGQVTAKMPGETGRTPLGAIEIVVFPAEDALMAVGNNRFSATDSAGAPSYGSPKEVGFGVLQQGYVELANVEMIDEMAALVMAQRAYQLNARVLQASDQILETINNLRR
jgi:flagellar basal-body rod protein FlgG